MKKYKSFVAFALIASTLVLSSCGDDNDGPIAEEEEIVKVNPKTVFTQGVPKEVGDKDITTNAEGQVTKIVDDEGLVVTFDYNGAPKTKSRNGVSIPTDYDMTMFIDDCGYKYMFYLKLNKFGYIEYAYEVVGEDNTTQEWWFKYNDNGQLIEMKRPEDYNEVTSVTYDEKGNITKVDVTNEEDGENNTCTYTISYTDAGHSTPIINKSGIMIYYFCFGVDLDEMDSAFYAGLLGKATTHLPLSNLEIDSYDESYGSSFIWTLNEAQMPTKFESVEEYETITMEFRW